MCGWVNLEFYRVTHAHNLWMSLSINLPCFWLHISFHSISFNDFSTMVKSVQIYKKRDMIGYIEINIISQSRKKKKSVWCQVQTGQFKCMCRSQAGIEVIDDDVLKWFLYLDFPSGCQKLQAHLLEDNFQLEISPNLKENEGAGGFTPTWNH